MKSGINSACYANTHINGKTMQTKFIVQHQKGIVRTKKKLRRQRGKNMRPIDADKLRERLQNLAYDDWNQGITTSFADACHEIIDIIEEQPTIEPQLEQRWIPCSEETGDGYPEEDGFYYVTEQNYGFYLDADYKQRVTHTSHFKNGDFTDRFYAENNSNITAWMPLPEPWEGGES